MCSTLRLLLSDLGKTTTAVHTLKALAHMGVSPILATADGNVAVDNIAEGLAKLGCNVVRVGRPEKVSAHMRQITLDSQVAKLKEQRALGRAAARVERDAKRLAELRANLAGEVDVIRAELLGLPIDAVVARARSVGLTDVTDAGDTPKKIEMRGCEAFAELNGDFKLSTKHSNNSIDTVIYFRKSRAKDSSLGKVFCFFGSDESRKGWWLSKRAPSMENVIGYSPVRAPLPPKSGWQFKQKKSFEADSGGFVNYTADHTVLVERICDSEMQRIEAEKVDTSAPEAEEVPDAKADKAENFELQLEVLQSADVICAQLISAGGDFLSKLGSFSAILIDEVAQSTELAAIVPIVQRGCERLILAGDHYQLPPSVQSLEAEIRGFTLSLYSRLVVNGIKPWFLDTQFRSHPKLAEFSASAIYGGRLRSGISAEVRPAVAGLQWPRFKVPVAFFEMGDNAREEYEGESKLNRTEGAKVLDLVEAALKAADCDESQIGVITPYMAQVRWLRQEWRRRSKTNGSVSANKLEIASVDNFQGREKEL